MVRPTRVRHVVLWLTVAAYMITYMDRVVIAAAAPVIQKEFAFDMVTMGWILSSFRWGYAFFQIPGGWLGDQVGPRRALTWIVTRSASIVMKLYALGSCRRRVLVAVPAWMDRIERLTAS